MKFRQKLDSNGKIYLPKLLRQQGFDGEIEIVPNTRCFLAYPPDVPVSQLLASLKIIQADLEQSARFEKVKK
jgi:hypothetical protein